MLWCRLDDPPLNRVCGTKWPKFAVQAWLPWHMLETVSEYYCHECSKSVPYSHVNIGKCPTRRYVEGCVEGCVCG